MCRSLLNCSLVDKQQIADGYVAPRARWTNRTLPAGSDPRSIVYGVQADIADSDRLNVPLFRDCPATGRASVTKV
jgi:hypothetical protein